MLFFSVKFEVNVNSHETDKKISNRYKQEFMLLLLLLTRKTHKLRKEIIKCKDIDI
jgi:hypothetical protein